MGFELTILFWIMQDSIPEADISLYILALLQLPLHWFLHVLASVSRGAVGASVVYHIH